MEEPLKKCEATKSQPDILRGGHKNPYQMENAIKIAEIVFHLSLGPPGSCPG